MQRQTNQVAEQRTLDKAKGWIGAAAGGAVALAGVEVFLLIGWALVVTWRKLWEAI